MQPTLVTTVQNLSLGAAAGTTPRQERELTCSRPCLTWAPALRGTPPPPPPGSGPIFLTLCHMLCCSLLNYCAAATRLVVPQKLASKRQLAKIVLLAVIFLLTIVLGNISLRYIPGGCCAPLAAAGALVPPVSSTLPCVLAASVPHRFLAAAFGLAQAASAMPGTPCRAAQPNQGSAPPLALAPGSTKAILLVCLSAPPQSPSTKPSAPPPPPSLRCWPFCCFGRRRRRERTCRSSPWWVLPALGPWPNVRLARRCSTRPALPLGPTVPSRARAATALSRRPPCPALGPTTPATSTHLPALLSLFVPPSLLFIPPSVLLNPPSVLLCRWWASSSPLMPSPCLIWSALPPASPPPAPGRSSR